jgi:hypothetical protein
MHPEGWSKIIERGDPVKHALSVIVAGCMIFILVACLNKEVKASASTGKDFYAGDEMHRLGINLTGIEEVAKMSANARVEKNKSISSDTQTAIRISVTANSKTTVFELNNSPAARDLYDQLPLSIPVENYGNNEKIFYPPEKLNTGNTPLADAQRGTLAYYAPWGDVVMFYGKFGSAAGLYELGHAISGSEHIRGMSGTIRIEITP